MESKGFQDALWDLEQTVKENPDMDDLPSKIEINFGSTGDTDLYYGIGKCRFVCTYTRTPSSVRVKFASKDTYNFDEIRTVYWDKIKKAVAFEFGVGNLANDLGLFSQRSEVISVYDIYIEFEETINLN